MFDRHRPSDRHRTAVLPMNFCNLTGTVADVPGPDRAVFLRLRRRWWLTAALIIAPVWPRLALAVLVFFGRSLYMSEAVGRGLVAEARPA